MDWKDLLFIGRVNVNQEAFGRKVLDVADRLGINPDWLMAVMYKESGLNAAAYNATGGAVGLIQFMPNTCAALGVTADVMRKLSNVAQLDYVYKYFYPYKGRLNSYPDVYLCTFFPRALGWVDERVIESGTLSAGLIATQNPAIDLDKNKQITVGEFRAYCYKGFSADVVERLKKKAVR